MSQQTGTWLWVEVESRPAKWTILGEKRLKFGRVRWDLAGSRALRRVNGCLKLLLERSGSTRVDCSPPPVKLNRGSAERQQCSWLFPNTHTGFRSGARWPRKAQFGTGLCLQTSRQSVRPSARPVTPVRMQRLHVWRLLPVFNSAGFLRVSLSFLLEKFFFGTNWWQAQVHSTKTN